MFNQLMADWGKVCQSKKWSAAGLQNLFQLLLAMLLLKHRIGEKQNISWKPKDTN